MATQPAWESDRDDALCTARFNDVQGILHQIIVAEISRRQTRFPMASPIERQGTAMAAA
jgi:hypothetical protein